MKTISNFQNVSHTAVCKGINMYCVDININLHSVEGIMVDRKLLIAVYIPITTKAHKK